MAMVARDPEQEMTIAMITRARRVGSVLISKSNFMGGDGEGGGAAREGCKRYREREGSVR